MSNTEIVRADLIFAPTALALSLFELEEITKLSENEITLRRRNEQVIRDALTYFPAFAKEIGSDLEKTRLLLTENGYSTIKENEAGIIDTQARDILNKFEPRELDSRERVKDLSLEVLRIVHPDKGTQISIGFSNEEVGDFISRAQRARNERDVKEAELAVLATKPRMLLAVIRDMLSEGKSLTQITGTFPEVVTQVQWLKVLARKRLPKPNQWVPLRNADEVDKEAEKIRRKADCHSRTEGLVLIYMMFADLNKFGKQRGLEPKLVAKMNFMEFELKNAVGLVGGGVELVEQYGEWLEGPLTILYKNLIMNQIKNLPEALFMIAQAQVASEINTQLIGQMLGETQKVVWGIIRDAKEYQRKILRIHQREEGLRLASNPNKRNIFSPNH